jgi:hypothetical protein
MSQFFRDLDFSTAREARYRIPLRVPVVQFNLEHYVLLRLFPKTSKTPRPRICMLRASDEMFRQNKLEKPGIPY